MKKTKKTNKFDNIFRETVKKQKKKGNQNRFQLLIP